MFASENGYFCSKCNQTTKYDSKLHVKKENGKNERSNDITAVNLNQTG
jgi:hypothetical protein